MTGAVACKDSRSRAAQHRPPSSLCALCGVPLGRASERGSKSRGVCGGCAERLELELTSNDTSACPDCGRHQELCAIMPCAPGVGTAPPVAESFQPPLYLRPARARPALMSGVERVRTIERLAATHLGVRELGRRTGLAPSTISRWLKIDRCPALKHALETELVDIGRAKLLADAPKSTLAELIPLAPTMSRAELARRIASSRAASSVFYVPTVDSQRLRRALRIIESISRVEVADHPTLERVRRLVDGLLGSEEFHSHAAATQ